MWQRIVEVLSWSPVGRDRPAVRYQKVTEAVAADDRELATVLLGFRVTIGKVI